MTTETQIPIFEIYDYVYVPFWQQAWFWPIVLSFLGLLCLLFVVLSLYAWKQWRIKKKKAWQIALEQLDSLRAENMQPKEFYCMMTAVLKQYLSAHFGHVLHDKTDLEVIEIFQTQEADKAINALVEHLFSRPLAIKFAKENVQIDCMNHDKQQCIALVRMTIKAPRA